ncbi:transmembrane protein, putative (macronuclear) [Tetrahymena thermophila SB210]|uniref:Transmembrane protein, putative n=1 Tax=Tetrahymena thermophila (strain SB210) TaxID=312017 RepID=W7XES8_TETTS|nr:transmembrane protein, putative [Tetrahymena thermophila SB210]EWS75248.1 transmembrane protein, putative [Tetrahymena thermophila SB210]|eukprot:XP_012652239.1 transmembrane protein, putative [Tetrahymena thermophila SB210]
MFFQKLNLIRSLINFLKNFQIFLTVYQKKDNQCQQQISQRQKLKKQNQKKNRMIYKDKQQFLITQSNDQQNLKLKFNDINSQDISDLSYKLQFFKNLKSLILEIKKNQLKNQDALEIISRVCQLEVLSELQIDLSQIISRQNLVDNTGLAQIGKQISQIKNLQTLKLELSQNHLNNKGVEELIQCLQKNKNICNLDLNLGFFMLYRNLRLDKQGASIIGEGLYKISNLKILFLGLQCNKIEDEGARIIVTELKENINITNFYLNLSQNNITNIGAAYLGTYLGQFKNIEYLKLALQSNKIENQGFFELVEGLGYCKTLKSLIIVLKQIFVQFIFKISSSIQIFINGNILYFISLQLIPIHIIFILFFEYFLQISLNYLFKNSYE